MAYFPDGAAPPTPTPIGSVTGASLSQAAIRGDGGGPAPRAVYTEHLAVPYVAPAVTQNMPRGFATGARTVRAGSGAAGSPVPVAARTAGAFTPPAPSHIPPGFP